MEATLALAEETTQTTDIDLDALASQISAKVALPENLSGMISEEIEKAFKDRRIDEIRRKVGLFGEDDLPKEVSPEEMRTQYLLAVMKMGIPNSQFTPLQRKALSEGTDSAGGYLVQTEQKTEIIQRLAELSELVPYVRRVPVITDAGTFPKLDTDVTITWGRAENAAMTETDAAFTQLTWAVANMSAITYLSRELVDDSNPGIVAEVTKLFSEKIAAERDKKIAIGTGSSQPEGLISASGLSAVTGASGALDYAKLVKLKHGLARKYQKKARWVMSSTAFQWCHEIVDSQNRPIVVDALVNSEMPKLLGKPYSIQDDLPDGIIVFGDLSYYIWFDRQKMIMETTNTGGDTFSKHQLAVKVIERCDGKVGLAEAFKKSGTFTVPT